MLGSSTFTSLVIYLKKWWRQEKNIMWPLVYRLLQRVLVLPVATATVKRCFSRMKFVKTYLRNRIGDDHMNYVLICYVEKEEMRKVNNDVIVRRFMEMRNRRFGN
jgi:hypothetical protein